MKRDRQRRATGLPQWQKEIGPSTALQLYPPGVALLRQGAAAQEVYALERGLVKLTCTGVSGREIILGLRASGDWLGGEAIVLREAAIYSAVTLTECELHRVPATKYLDWLKTDPDFAWRRHEAQSRELIGQMQHAVDMVCASARQRLEQLLWQMVRELAAGQRNARMQLPMQQQELASLLLVTPSHLSRLFKQLEQARLLRRDKGWLVIPAPERLWHAREAIPRLRIGAPAR